MSMTEIQQAITELSVEELTQFHEWFDEYCAQVWDKQIETDAQSGRLDKIIAEVNEEIALIEARRN